MKAARAVLAAALALALQTTLARVFLRGTNAVDFVLVVVVYAALTGGPITGLLTGTFAGLVQDTLSTGVVGIGGLAKTVVGFLSGVVGTQFIVAQPVPRFVVFFVATIVHAVVFYGLYMLLDLRQYLTQCQSLLTSTSNGQTAEEGNALLARLDRALADPQAARS